MIRTLLATTAMAGLLATGAYAQDASTPAPAPAPSATEAPAAAPAVVPADGFLATNLIGESVYNGTGDNAETIGNVNDLVIGANGTVDAIVVGIGGFLGIGEKNVAIDFKSASWAEGDGDRWLVVDATRESLEALPEFDRAPYNVAPPATAQAPSDPAMAPAPNATAEAPATPAPDATAEAPAATAAPNATAEAPADPAKPAADATAEAPADPAAKPAPDATAEAPAATAAPNATAEAPATTAPDASTTAAIDKSTLKEMPADKIRAEELVGTTVYGANDENIGEIGDIVLSTDNKIDAIIIDVGGFLGIGEKEVAIGMDNLAFMTDADGNTYLYTNFTKEQLDAQAAYDESTWAQNRDQQRMMVQ